jgi:hypothetical protein
MSKVKWELIFINSFELKSYLSILDLIELSKLNSLLRFKLKSQVFKNILIGDNIDNIVFGELQKSNGISEGSTCDPSDLSVEEYTSVFRSSLQPILPYVKKANISENSNHYQLLELSRLLPQLVNLTISDTIIGLTAFKNALANLKSLASFRIDSTNLIVYRNETDPITPIELPNSLKYLDWQYCTVSLSQLDEDPQSVSYNYTTSLAAHNVFRFQPDHFPKLKKFSSHLLPITFNNEFLSANPQLDSLNFNIEEFNITTSVFGFIENISKLELKIDYLDLDLNAIRLSLPKLAHLSFYQLNFGTWPILQKILESSPNLKVLSIINPVYTSRPLFEVINNMPNLKKLIIHSNIVLGIDSFIPNQSLNSLEFWFRADIRSILYKLDNCSNFKVVSFNKKFFNDRYMENLEQQSNFNSWRLINIDDCLNYYRLPYNE